ncbi:unnamed protein product [Effrenium voratum]|nr:unnamed protein product [Effrenium voratum]
MPSVTAKCCASLRRFLRFLVGAPGAPRAPSPPASIVEAPAEVPLPAPEEVLAPPAPALTLLQQEFDLAANAARAEVNERVKYFRSLNGGGSMTRMQELEIRNLWNCLIKTAELKRMQGEEEEARQKAEASAERSTEQAETAQERLQERTGGTPMASWEILRRSLWIRRPLFDHQIAFARPRLVERCRR